MFFRSREAMAEGAVLLRGFAGSAAAGLIADIDAIAAQAPFRHMVTPGGHQMSVAMTNCGDAGWMTDRSAAIATTVSIRNPRTAVAGDAGIVSRAGRGRGGRGGI